MSTSANWRRPAATATRTPSTSTSRTDALHEERRMSSMHPRMAELVRRLDATHRLLHAAVQGLSDEAARARPAPDRWSVAEVVEHLRRAETGTVRLLLHLNHKTQALEAETATDSALATLQDVSVPERAT